MKIFEVKTRWSTTPDCFLIKETYQQFGNHIALSIFSESDGPFADLTVNVAGMKNLPKNEACVDVNNFPEGPALIERLGIGKPTRDVMFSGFCAYPVYDFDLDAIKTYTEEE